MSETKQKRPRTEEEKKEAQSLVQQSVTATLCESLSYLHFGDRSNFVTTCAQFYSNLRLRQVHGPLIFDLQIPTTRELLIRSDSDPSGKLFETNVLLPAARANTIQWIANRDNSVPNIAQWLRVLSAATHVTRIEFDVPTPKESIKEAVAVLWHQMLVGIGTTSSPTLNEIKIRGLGVSCELLSDADTAETVEEEYHLVLDDWINAFQPRWATLRIFELDLSTTSDDFTYDSLSTFPLPYLALTPTQLLNALEQLVVIEQLHVPICLVNTAERTTLLDFARAKPTRLTSLKLDCWRTDEALEEPVDDGPGTTDEDFLEFFRHWQTMLIACTALKVMQIMFATTEMVSVQVPEHATWAIVQNDRNKPCTVVLSNLFTQERGNVGLQRHLDLVKLSGIRYFDQFEVRHRASEYHDGKSIIAAAPELDWKDGPLDIVQLFSPDNTTVLASPQSVGFLVKQFPSLQEVMDSGTSVYFYQRVLDGKLTQGQFGAEFSADVGVSKVAAYGHRLWESKRGAITKLSVFGEQEKDPTDTDLAGIADAFRGLTSLSLWHLKTPVRVVQPVENMWTKFPHQLFETSPDLEVIELRLPMGLTDAILWEALGVLSRRKLRHVTIDVGRAQIIGTVATQILRNLVDLVTLNVTAAYDPSEAPEADGALDPRTFFADLASRHPNLTDLKLKCRFWPRLDALPTNAKWAQLRKLTLGWYGTWSIGAESIDEFVKRHPALASIDLGYDEQICASQKTEGLGNRCGPCSLAQEAKWRETWGKVQVTLPMDVPLLMLPEYDAVQDIESKLPWMAADYKRHNTVGSLQSLYARQTAKHFADLLIDSFGRIYLPRSNRGGLSGWRFGSRWLLLLGFRGRMILVDFVHKMMELVPRRQLACPFETWTDFPESLRQTIVDEWPELVAIKVVDPTEYLHPFQCMDPSDFETTSWVNSNLTSRCDDVRRSPYLLPSLKRSHITHWMNMGKDKDKLH